MGAGAGPRATSDLRRHGVDAAGATHQDRNFGEAKPRVPRSVAVMLTALTHSFVYVLDQDEALDFYVGKLGLEVGTDADLGPMRWLTVIVPGRPEREIVLSTPRWAMTRTRRRRSATRRQGRRQRHDLQRRRLPATYEELVAKGVEFTQEPTEHFYGIDCGLRDPFGNPLRITSPPRADQVPDPV